MFARQGPSGEPIAIPSICRCIMLLKLKSTEQVASSIISTNTLRGKVGGVERKLIVE